MSSSIGSIKCLDLSAGAKCRDEIGQSSRKKSPARHLSTLLADGTAGAVRFTASKSNFPSHRVLCLGAQTFCPERDDGDSHA
jgi:hypothetical protein